MVAGCKTNRLEADSKGGEATSHSGKVAWCYSYSVVLAEQPSAQRRCCTHQSFAAGSTVGTTSMD